VPEREQVMFDLIWNSVSRPVRKLMRITGNLLVGGLALASVPAAPAARPR
jgi:hypothetical protein